MKYLFFIPIIFMAGCSQNHPHLMEITEVVMTNGGSSFLGNDGGVWNFVATDGKKEYRNFHHSIVKVGDKICVNVFTIFGEEDMVEWSLSKCS